jgi:hypothetical protein
MKYSCVRHDVSVINVKNNLLQNGRKGCENNTLSLFKCYNKNNKQNNKVFIKILYVLTFHISNA